MSKKPKVQLWYKNILDEKTPKKPILSNCIKAFVFGGLLCVVLQLVQNLLVGYLAFDQKEAASVSLVLLIAATALLTGLGHYDKLAQIVGAGLAVPITGFANSVASALIEYRSEGYVLGSGCNSFKLAGAVVVFGVVSAFFVALISLLLGVV